MTNNPFGGFGPGAGGDRADWQRNFETLGKQYWSAWGDALRAGGGQPATAQGMPGWQEAVQWWSQLAHSGRGETNDLVERFNTQARHWFGQMQQVAARFAGQDHSPGQIADAWKQALGAAGENPFPEIFRAMRGHGQQGLEQWVEDASPWLDAIRREGVSWMSMPAFGLNREHTERMQSLARAQVDAQEKQSACNALMAKAGERAFELFESKLAVCSEPGRQLKSARALFDLWIDAAEEAYAEIALSPEFRKVYGELVNAQMRLRNGVQKEVEHTCATLGMPTRSEIDAAHRKVAELERALRTMQRAASGASTSGVQPTARKATGKRAAAANAGEAEAVSAAPKRKAPAKKSASRKAVSSNAVTKKPASKEVASNKKVAGNKPSKKESVKKGSAEGERQEGERQEGERQEGNCSCQENSEQDRRKSGALEAHGQRAQEAEANRSRRRYHRTQGRAVGTAG